MSRSVRESLAYKVDLVTRRVDNLEETVKIMGSEEVRSISKKPYRCPICYGESEIELFAIEQIAKNRGCKFKICHGCEGKGIVWG